MSLEGWEEEEISFIDNGDDIGNIKMLGQKQVLEYEQQNDEIPLEIIDYSCLNTFETIVQKVEMFLLNTLQTHEDLQSLWKSRTTCNNNNSSEEITTTLQENTAMATLEQQNKECNNDDSYSKAHNDSNYSSSNDSLKSCESFTSPTSLSLNKEETSRCDNSNSNSSEKEPIIIGKTFAINASSSRYCNSDLCSLEINTCTELSQAVSVEIHLHDNSSPITQLYNVPFFILIKRAHVQETCNTSEANYYLSVLMTAMNNVLSHLSSMSLHRFFAPLQNGQSTLQEMYEENTLHLVEQSSLLLTSPYSWHETCVPCFTPIGPVEDGLYIGATPLCPVYCQTPSSLTPFNGNYFNDNANRTNINSEYCRSSNINNAPFVNEMNKSNEQQKEERHYIITHSLSQKEELQQEDMSCVGDLLMKELLAPRLCTEFSFTTHSTLPFNIFDLSVLCDVFRLHLGPQSRICTANTNSKTNCKYITHDNTTKMTACEDACGICISVQKLYTLAMPYRFQPPHHEASLPEMTSIPSPHEEQMEFEPTPLSWNEVIRRENDRLKVICGVECYPIGTREPPITHLNVHFNWHALNERDLDELNTRTSNHDFTVDSCGCDLHDDLDPFAMHINCNAWKQKSVNNGEMRLEESSSEELLSNLTLHEKNNTHCKLLNEECSADDVTKSSDCYTSADAKCTITLSTDVIQSDKLHHLLNDQVQDAWDDILARLQELLMHTHGSNYTTSINNTWCINSLKHNTMYKTREEVCLDDQHNTHTSEMLKHRSEVDYKKLERLANELFASNPCALAVVNATGNSNNNYTATQYDYEAEATLQRFYIDQLWSESLQSSWLEKEQYEEECELQKWDKARLRKAHTNSASRRDIRSSYIPCSLLNRFAHLCVKSIRRAEEIFILWHLCIAQLTSLITTCISTDDNYNNSCGDEIHCHDDMEKRSINANAVHNIIKMIGMPESDEPVDLTQSLLAQKLQMLTYCLRFLLHEESEKSQTTFFAKEKYNIKNIFTGKGNKKRNKFDGWSDDNDDDDDNNKNSVNRMSKGCKDCTSADSTVNVIKNENVHTDKSINADDMCCLITNGEAVVVPPVIPEFPRTSDALMEHAFTLQKFIAGMHSVRAKEQNCQTDNIYRNNNNDASSCLLDEEWLNHDALYNDMCLFLYVNNAHHGRVVRFADFIHWHSPRDFIYPDDMFLCEHHKNNKKANNTEQEYDQNDEEHTFFKKEKEIEGEPFTVNCEAAVKTTSTTTRTSKQMPKHLERKLEEETSHEQYSEIDDNLFLSERMQYHNIDNESAHNHIWWYLWKNARPRKLEEIVHDAFNARYELLSLCKWLYNSVEESDLLQEILKATVANVLHPILCHRINFVKHNIIVENTIEKEHLGNDRINVVKRSSVTETMLHYVMQISSHINNLNKMHAFEQTQNIVSVRGKCEHTWEDNQSQTYNIISLYRTMWKDVCMLNYVLSHALAVQCILGDPAIFETEKTIDTRMVPNSPISTAHKKKRTRMSSIAQKLSSLINYNLCDEYVAFDECKTSWETWNDVIAPRFTKQSDKKVKNVEAKITCLAERPLKTYPCYQQMIIKYNSNNNLTLTFALTKEVL